LSWMWYELSRNPNLEERLANEWHKMSEVDVKKLTLTGQFFKETLRLYPAAWVLLREAIEPVTLQGNQFKKGSSFLISPYLMHRHPTYFENPDQIDVDRFSSDDKAQVSFSYLPFGAGPRSCIGSQFATYEARLIMCVIGREFRLSMIENHHPVEAEPLISLRIKNGLYMMLHKREQ
ncbi:MAG: cytochrome P450, partial [Anaerobacillus sp.]